MKKVFIAFIATLLSITAFAEGPGSGGDQGAFGWFSEGLYASESSSDLTTYVWVDRTEYADGYAWGNVDGHVNDTHFSCSFNSDQDMLTVDKDFEHAVIHVDPESIESCWTNWLPAPITFDCVVSGYMEYEGVSNYGAVYYDGYEYKAHTKSFEKALDCVVFIGDDIVLDASSGVVHDGVARAEKYIYPNQERDD